MTETPNKREYAVLQIVRIKIGQITSSPYAISTGLRDPKVSLEWVVDRLDRYDDELVARTHELADLIAKEADDD